MPCAAVLGSPVDHSLSPLLHEAGYAACGLTDWRYTRHDVVAEQLVGYVAGLDRQWRGLSLTMPLKEAAFEVAATVSEVARRAGAINTLVRRVDGAWDATNTDVAGIVAAVRGVEHGGRARVLGSGATARSAVLALAQLGVERVEVAARNPATAAGTLALAVDVGLDASTVDLADWAREPGRLVVSTLPPVASGPVGALLAEAGANGDGLTVLDVVYANWPTPLATAVLAAGGRVISGLDMLVHQAAAQFRLFTGLEPPVAAMLAAGRAALDGRGVLDGRAALDERGALDGRTAPDDR